MDYGKNKSMVLMNIGVNKNIFITGILDTRGDPDNISYSTLQIGSQNPRDLKQIFGGCITGVYGGEEGIYRRSLVVRGGPEGSLLFRLVVYKRGRAQDVAFLDKNIEIISVSYINDLVEPWDNSLMGCKHIL